MNLEYWKLLKKYYVVNKVNDFQVSKSIFIHNVMVIESFIAATDY